MNKLFKFSVFFVSYTPLWLSIIYIDLMNVFYHNTMNPWTERISITSIFMAYLISIPNLIQSMQKLRQENSEKFTINAASEQKTASLEYILTFVLPMFAFEFTQWENLVMFLLYFVVLSYLVLKHNLLVANIVLELLRYQFYEVTLEDGYGQKTSREVISKRRLENLVTEDIYLHSMNNGLWCDVTDAP